MEELTDWQFAMCDGHYWLMITDYVHFLEYHLKTDESRYGNAFLNAGDFGENKKEKGNTEKMIEAIARRQETTIFDATANLSSRVFKAQSRYLREGFPIFINKGGGWNNCMNPTLVIKRKNMVFPDFKESDIRIKQWGEGYGFHFYAYIDDFEIHDGDAIKWNTEYEAMKAARKYIEKEE